MWIKTSLAVLGMMGALAAATPTSAVAQGVHINCERIFMDETSTPCPQVPSGTRAIPFAFLSRERNTTRSDPYVD
jgi:hypothetical protein